MEIPFVDLTQQYLSIKHDIDRAIEKVMLETSFIGGSFVKQFENDFSSFCRAAHCIGVGNGTDAIYIALRALGVSEGDEVITVANSFIATSEAISLTGARVRFVDCDEHTYNIIPEQVSSAINERTKAIVPVHLYGQPAPMGELKRIASEHGLYLVEDAAQAHGAEIEGQRVGTIGDLSCFSFYPGKNLGAYGDAGAIVTNDDNLAARCRMIANHGRIKKYNHKFEGINSRLDGLQAAILSAKLKHLDEWTKKRRVAAAAYHQYLAGSGVCLPIEAEGNRHVYHLYVVRVQNRAAVQSRLKELNIATGVHYPIALPNLQAYSYLGHKPEDFPVATQYSKEILSLPMFPELSRDQVEYVCVNLLNAISSSEDVSC